MIDKDGQDYGDDEGGEEPEGANDVERQRRVSRRLNGFGSHDNEEGGFPVGGEGRKLYTADRR